MNRLKEVIKSKGLKKIEFEKLLILEEKSIPRSENGKYVDPPKS